MSSADDHYEQRNDFAGDAPTGNVSDNDYASRTDQSQIPVQKDDAPVENPIDPATADSDETLVRDENEAIDQSNIIESHTRGATKKAGTYTEPGDEEGLPGPDDGTSTVRR
ncbi:hypothetical protein AOQ84DRAFT_388365 [Glonium stellatum]|uniref:Histone chaperone domain-containing protein n=1 Tax=Glonium stellatum TaxID=574774 RepID=A0A8E2F3C3_9PEZI|nr:hypothetical protein AOQ84DRAFT_388365 [Glonium stellatum]